MAANLSLSQQNAIRLAAVFVVFEILVAVAVVFLLMLPMAQRAARDLAGLMVLSAQTWAVLPLDQRPAFEADLVASHGIVLTGTAPPDVDASSLHGPYMEELEASLSIRTGQPVRMLDARQGDDGWHWAAIPGAGQTLWIGFSHGRVGPQPATTALIIFLVGLAFSAGAAWWLARRTVAPLKRFEAAAASLGRGERPALLPETGPRELAALAHRFNELARQVQDLLEARTTLLAGLSHDLRTPLARMRLALEMLERRPDPAWIKRLETDIDEMNRLVGNLLDLARGLGREEAEPTDVAGMLADLAARAREAGAAVTVHAEPCLLAVPPTGLRRLLANLLANAQRYGAGSPIELALERGPGGCRLGVFDRGPGIPQDQLEAVFRPFHRIESSRSPVTGGTGLGLAIVRQLAQAHGWRVWLENRRGGGLVAWVAVPSAPGASGATPASAQEVSIEVHARSPS